MGKKLDKNILFLASWYPSKKNPTLGNFVQKHAEIANEISNVDVLFAVSSETVEKISVVDEIINKVRTIVVYYPANKSKIPYLSTFLKKETYLLALKTGYKHLNKDYDLVHLNITFPAGLFAKWLNKNYKIPYIITEQWTGFLPHHKVYESMPFYLKSAYQSIFKSARAVLPVSDHLGKSLQNLGLVNDFTVLNNVVKSNYFYPRGEEKLKKTTDRFLHVSTFDEDHKNISGMLSSFSKLKKDFVLHLVTEGEELEVWNAIERHNIPKDKCIVESKLTVDKVGDAMRAADCLVLFSNYETFSVVLAEAWVSGIPVIYSQCGGLTEINNSELGVQIQPRDEKALYEALENFSKAQYNANNINDFSQQFSEEFIKKKLLTLY